MRVLITSGGTKVPIDPVRDITNMSHGTFGSKIAASFLEKGCEVLFFTAKEGITPFLFTCDLWSSTEKFSTLPEVFKFYFENKDRYSQDTFRNYDDYVTGLKRNIESFKPDIVVLAAAVSDYTTKASDSKLRSKEQQAIFLTPTEKVISKIKEWSPDVCLVGFKLLVDATEEELEQAARDSIEKNGCDMVVANDLSKLKSGNHEVRVVKYNSNTMIAPKKPQADFVVTSILEMKNIF